MVRFARKTATLAFVLAACALCAAAPAGAVQRYASPAGTGPAASCPSINPCNVVAAITDASVNDGDEVILTPGTYNVGSTAISFGKGIDIHGTGRPADTTIVSTATNAITFWSATAQLRDLTIDQSVGPGSALFAQNGIVDEVVAKSSGGGGCAVIGVVTMRDTICASSATNQAGISANNSGGTNTITLRNVTAIGSGTNSFGIFASAGVGPTTVSLNCLGVIARGVRYDIEADAASGTNSTIALTNSNFSAVNTQGTGTTTVSLPTVNANQTTAPVFVNAAAGDYHEAPGSPTIDAGAVDGQSGATDVDGEARSQGAAPDIDADEFTVAPAPPGGGKATPPQTKIGKHPKRRTTSRRARFTFSSDETGSSFRCKLDKRAWSACASPFAKKVKPGRHKLLVAAVNTAGQADATPAVFKWTVLRG